MELFRRRAREVRAEFVLTSENGPVVAEICHRLDGLPLAIERAAARIRLLSPQALLSRLVGAPLAAAPGRPQGSPLRLLTGGARDLPARQRTLHDLMAWSYDLLSEAEKALFRRLAVFRGGCTLESDEAICSDDGPGLGEEVLDLLTSLVEKSLLHPVQGPGGEPRFTMLETVREYARERLAASREEPEIHRRHVDFFVALAEQAIPSPQGLDLTLLDRLDLEHDNLRGALSWSETSGDIEVGVRLAGALAWPFWRWRGHWSEGRGWLARLLALSDSYGSTAARGRAFYGAGHLARWQGDAAAARANMEQALAIWRELGEPKKAAECLSELGRIASYLQGDRQQAAVHFRRSAELSRAIGATSVEAVALVDLGDLEQSRGDGEAARSLYEQSLALSRAHGHRRTACTAIHNLAHLALSQSRTEQARALFEELRCVLEQLGGKRGTADALYGLGLTAQRQGDPVAARRYLEECRALRDESKDPSGLARCLTALGQLARSTGDLEAARSLHAQSLSIRWELRDQSSLALELAALGEVALAQGQADRAARLCGAVQALHRAIASEPAVAMSEGPDCQPTAAAACALLGEEAFAAAWAEGLARPLEAAIKYALEETAAPGQAPAGARGDPEIPE